MRPLRLAATALLVCAWMGLVSTTGCQEAAAPRGAARTSGADPCTAQPLESFDAALDGASSQDVVTFSGEVAEFAPADAFGRNLLRVAVSGGGEQRVWVRNGGRALPVETGRTYAFRVEHVGGSPPASALVIRDADGLVFAGVSDQGIGDHVLRDGLPGFTLSLGAVTCPSRGAGECYRAAMNRTLDVAGAGAGLSLYSSDSGRIGAYLVRCLAAQRVDAAGCPDFGMHDVSFTIERTAAAR